MKKIMKSLMAGLAVLATLAMLGGDASADIVAVASIPTTDVLYSQDTGNTATRLIDEDANANHARGSFFSLATDPLATGYEINAISLESNETTDFSGTTAGLSLFIFEGTQAQFDSGTGHSTATDGGNFYVDTNVTPLLTETSLIDTSITSGGWVTFELANPLAVSNGGDFGFFFTYEQGDSGDDDLDHREGTNSASVFGRSSISTTNHATSGTRALNFAVQGVAVTVPEPTSVALLGLGALGMVTRRRRR